MKDKPKKNYHKTYESNGPKGRQRGTARQLYDKYISLADNARTMGDRIMAESLAQYADHYYRIDKSK